MIMVIHGELGGPELVLAEVSNEMAGDILSEIGTFLPTDVVLVSVGIRSEYLKEGHGGDSGLVGVRLSQLLAERLDRQPVQI